MSNRKPAGVYVALMRGINVGGKNKLPMADLAALFAEAGCTDVRTYIQSGNVVFRAGAAVAKRIPGLVAERVAARFGFEAPLILRAADAFQTAATKNPLLAAGAEPETLHVGFLADLPPKRLVDTLDANRSPGDSFALRGREIYLRLGNGMAKTKLTNAYFDSKLATTSTFRNWRTVRTLLGMIEANDRPGAVARRRGEAEDARPVPS